jgi:CTD small phosphatase-like protein 2
MAIIDKYTKNLPLSVGLSRHSYRHLIFSPNTTEEIFKKHLLITYKGLKYVKNRLSKPSVQYLK